MTMNKYRHLKEFLKYPTKIKELADTVGVTNNEMAFALNELVKLKLVDRYQDTYVNRRNPYRIKAGDKYLTPAEVVLVFHPSNTRLYEEMYGAMSSILVSLADVHYSDRFTIQDYLDDLDNYIKRYELRLQAIKILRRFFIAFKHHYMIGVITSFMELTDDDLDDLKESAQQYDREHEPRRSGTVESNFEQFDRAVKQRARDVRKFAVRGRTAARAVARTSGSEEGNSEHQTKRSLEETLARFKARADGEDS